MKRIQVGDEGMLQALHIRQAEQMRRRLPQ
jgi:hypothetical protein